MHCCGNMAAVCSAGSIGGLTGAVSHLDGSGQDVVLHDLCAQVGVLQEALKVQPKLLESGIDGVVGGRKQGDARNLVGQDGCACMHSTSQHGTAQLQGLQGRAGILAVDSTQRKRMAPQACTGLAWDGGCKRTRGGHVAGILTGKAGRPGWQCWALRAEDLMQGGVITHQKGLRCWGWRTESAQTCCSCHCSE